MAFMYSIQIPYFYDITLLFQLIIAFNYESFSRKIPTMDSSLTNYSSPYLSKWLKVRALL